MGLHRRVDDGSIAPVEAPDALTGELRVGYVRIDPAAGREIPPAHAAQPHVQQRAQRCGNLGERSSLLVPRIAKRGVTVADMYCPGGNVHAVSERAAAAEDHIARWQPESPDGHGVERQQAPEVALTEAQTLKRG